MEIRTPAAELQYQIFRAIAQKCGEKKAVIAIAEALNLGQSAVYNRLNGRQVLHLEEAVTLARHFDLHLDPWIIGNGQKAIFDLRTLRAPVTSCRDFLTPIAQQLALLASLPDLVLWYSTNEVPFFHYMNFRELSLFKLFAWARINWQLHAFQHFKFDPAHFPEPEVFESLMQPMLQDYTAIRGIEFWNLNIFDNTLSQIQYFRFKPVQLYFGLDGKNAHQVPSYKQ